MERKTLRETLEDSGLEVRGIFKLSDRYLANSSQMRKEAEAKLGRGENATAEIKEARKYALETLHVGAKELRGAPIECFATGPVNYNILDRTVKSHFRDTGFVSEGDSPIQVDEEGCSYYFRNKEKRKGFLVSIARDRNFDGWHFCVEPMSEK